jgi:cytochrome P450/NADPH-cytochrome P450 reductase
MSGELPIPQPPTHFLVGNLPDVDSSHMLVTYQQYTKQYGPIFALDMVRERVVYCGSQALVNELCDEKRFEKYVAGALYQVRNLAGTGLFTAKSHEHDWALAHKLLMPAFGPLAIRKMFPEMVDIAGQMLMKWQRFGPQNEIDVSDAFTRLTLDTIALCSFDYRFNSFYQSDMHPFVTKALDALLESGRRAGRTELETRVRKWSQDKYDDDIAYCWKLCDELVADRKANPTDVNDLLNIMLKARDPETGEGMRDELIRYEM